MRSFILLLLAIMSSATASAMAAPTFPDRGRAGVVDAAHVLTPAAARALNERVVEWNRRTGHQLVVATLPDLQGLDVKTYGYQLGRAWGLGDKERNDGVILLLSMQPHEVRIEVGYGLEPVLTDAATSAILADKVVPRLKAGDVPGALSAGAAAIMVAAQSEQVRVLHPNQAPSFSWRWLLNAIGIAAGFLALVGAVLAWWTARVIRRDRRRMERMAAEARLQSAKVQRQIDQGARPTPSFRLSSTDRPGRVVTPPPSPPRRAAPTYVAPVYDPPAPPSSSSSSSSWSLFDSGSSAGSSDSGLSSSGFDSGGGSFGGGGSDSSW